MRLAPLLLACLLLAACGTSKSDTAPEPSGSGVHVLVTADWSKTKLTEGKGPVGSVLTATQAVAPTETSYGGRYVSSLAGEAGDGAREWVFWLNGIESPVGAADVDARSGDRIWWDLHRWAGRTHVPAIVGQWPAPLADGASADPAAAKALAAAGVDATTPATTSGPRAIVGANDALAQRDPTWRAALADPERAGLTAWIAKGRIVVWDAAAGKAVPVPKATAVVVATTEGFDPTGAPVVVIAGRTAADAEAAAAALTANPQLSQRHAAICLSADALIACSGGQGLTL